jgi:hypothetical protein
VKQRTGISGELSHSPHTSISDRGLAVMKHVSIPWVRTAPTTASDKKSFLTWILESLHYSRRLQAQRFIQSHRHLIASSRDCPLIPATQDSDNAHR